VSVTPSSNSITTAQSLTVAHLAKFAEGAEAPQVLNAMVEMRARRARVRRRVAGLLRIPQSSEQNAPDLDHVKVVDQVSTVVDVLEILAKMAKESSGPCCSYARRLTHLLSQWCPFLKGFYRWV